MTRVAIVAGALVAPGIAAAHPDHVSAGSYGLTHLLTDPFHVGLACVAALAAVTTWRAVQRVRATTRR